SPPQEQSDPGEAQQGSQERAATHARSGHEEESGGEDGRPTCHDPGCHAPGVVTRPEGLELLWARRLQVTASPDRTSASSAGRETCGQCPPGMAIASTPRRSRAALRDHSGRIVRSSVQMMYEEGTLGQDASGQTSAYSPSGYQGVRVVRAHSAISGGQSWYRKVRAMSASVDGSLPIHSGLNIVSASAPKLIGEADAEPRDERGQEDEPLDRPRYSHDGKEEPARGVSDGDDVVVVLVQRRRHHRGIAPRAAAGLIAGEIRRHHRVAATSKLRREEVPNACVLRRPVNEAEE